MAQNLTNEYRKFRYYEGVCSSSDFVKEIAKVLSFGVKSEPQDDAPAMPYKSKNWDIVYPMVSKDFAKYDHLNTREKYLGLTEDSEDGVDQLDENMRIAKLENQIAQITDTVVLRTKTTPKRIASSEIDDLSVSGDSDAASTTMYLQIWKPKYLANPEEYPLDAELHGITPQLITKDMYQESRKSTAAVLYDLALLKDINEDNGYPDTAPGYNLVKAEKKDEFVDAVSNAMSYDELFADGRGIFCESNTNMLFSIAPPDSSNGNRVTKVTLSGSTLQAIKQVNLTIYNFLFKICGLRSTFTEADYDAIHTMKIMVTAIGDADKLSYFVTLCFNKKVEIFTIAGPDSGGVKYLDVATKYGHEAIDVLSPELYSEGRYIPLPDDYIESSDERSITFNTEKPIKFCLDKVIDEEVLYGTIVIRYNYDKHLNYTDIHSIKITDSITMENNHYCLMRLFDNPNVDFSGPEPNITDNKGVVTATNSHASPWSKLSWYQDFEEIMMDDIDEDVSVTSVTDGTLLVPLETAGLTSDTRLSYWINTNNDRFSLIVMGNPALDYERDRHLISTCYCGRIESFENSINDVSGNFALYTSSSTTPCKTVMTTHDTQYPIDRQYSNDEFIKDLATVERPLLEKYKGHCELIGGLQERSSLRDANGASGFTVYYITLTGNKFFNESQLPSYMLIRSNGEPINLSGDPENPVYYEEVPYKDFIYGSSDSRSNQIMIYLQNLTILEGDTDYSVYFNFGYYEEKFVIESGITRDLFGNVVDIQTEDSYGKNTSDGVTSVSMYHTRSRAFYQKHHFLFATTEEYMSKVMYGKSSYTGEYYADRIKITHGNDGPRGILSDTLVIDSSSLYPKDELVINKDFEKSKDELEETFTYFPITAPFSPLADGPNSRYGLALKKAEKEPEYTDNNKILEIAKNQLDTIMINKQIVSGDVPLPSKTDNGCDVYWTVLNKTGSTFNNWIEAQNDDSDNPEQITMHFADGSQRTFTGHRYESNNVDIVVDTWEDPEEIETDPTMNPIAIDISAGSKPTKDFISYIKLTHTGPSNNTFELTVNNNTETKHAEIIFGYSDEELTFNKSRTLTCIIDDGTDIGSRSGFVLGADAASIINTERYHEYAYLGDMYADLYNKVSTGEFLDKVNERLNNTEGNLNHDNYNHVLYNAHPAKFLNVFVIVPGEKVELATNDIGEVINNVHPDGGAHVDFSNDNAVLNGWDIIDNADIHDYNIYNGWKYTKKIVGYKSIPLAPTDWDAKFDADLTVNDTVIVKAEDEEYRYFPLENHQNELINNNYENEYVTGDHSYFSLLKYPCSIVVYTSGVNNTTNNGILSNGTIKQRHEFLYKQYGQPFSISAVGLQGKVTLTPSDYFEKNVDLGNMSGTIQIDGKYVIDDSYIGIPIL